MAVNVLMPKMGLTMTEGTIGEWKKKEGEAVKKGEVLFTVETDKLTNDVEADADGILLKILCKEGETAECKATIAYIGEAGETVGDAAAPAAAAPAQNSAAAPVAAAAPAAASVPAARVGEYALATPYAKMLAKEMNYDLAMIPASGPNGVIVAKDVENYSGAPRIKLSPMAAKLAVELGVDVASFESMNRIMKADILEAAGRNQAAAETAAAQEAPAAAVAAPAAEPAAESNDMPAVKVNGLRRSIAANMSKSWSTSPRVTFTRPVDATGMKELRAKLKDSLATQGIKFTYNHILMKVCAKALSEFPDINASFSDNMLTRHIHANVGLAVAKGDGLIVPNVKRCEEKSLAEIAKETEELIAATRAGKLSMDDMTGGTFTISSLGAYGITNFSPIINQPELAILGVCDIVDTPVVRNGEIVIRPMMNLCLTADHRVIDGVMAAKFLKRIAELLENPYMLLV